jgi:two-component system NtrC family sensor kinase
MQVRVAELAMLYEVALTTLTSTLDTNLVAERALTQIQRLFDTDSILLIQPGPASDELCITKALVGTRFVEPLLALPAGHCASGWVLDHRRPLRVEDTQNDPGFSCPADQPLGIQTRSLLAAPLLIAGRILGQIMVTSNRVAAFTLDDLRMLEAIAFAVAVALDNAHLYEEQVSLLREREQAQEQLIRSEKMAALGRLTASIAHEINNPLQSVRVCLNLAEEELAGKQRREKMERYLGLANEEIERVALIVHRMRDFYRPAHNAKQPTDLHATLQAVLALTDKQLQHSNVTTTGEWADLPLIQANADHLKQVFLNLVLNAVDAMPQGGTLRVRTSLDRIQGTDGRQAVPAVRIEFSDTGVGMPEEVLPHLFEPFFTTKEHGSGLGLFVSFGIIESHRGQITVESQVGEGTTFTILLPVEQPDES